MKSPELEFITIGEILAPWGTTKGKVKVDTDFPQRFSPFSKIYIIPAIEDVVKSIDLNKGCVVIETIEGLPSLNQKTAN